MPGRPRPASRRRCRCCFDYPEGLRARLLPLAAQALAEAGAIARPASSCSTAPGPSPSSPWPRAMLAEAEGDAAGGAGRLRPGGPGPRPHGPRPRPAPGGGTAPRHRQHRHRPGGQGAGGDAVRLARRCRGIRPPASASPSCAATPATPAARWPCCGRPRRCSPNRAAQLRPAIGAAFLAALAQEPPLAAVALFEPIPTCCRPTGDGEAAMLTLAERLVALDLADRAAACWPGGRAGAGRRPRRAGAARRRRCGSPRAMRRGPWPRWTRALADAAAGGADAGAPHPRAPGPQARPGQRGEAARLAALGPAGAEPLAQMLADLQDWTGARGRLRRPPAGHAAGRAGAAR